MGLENTKENTPNIIRFSFVSSRPEEDPFGSKRNESSKFAVLFRKLVTVCKTSFFFSFLSWLWKLEKSARIIAGSGGLKVREVSS